MEKLIVENFGPIKKAAIELKEINIFIGTTSSGKSLIAKLVTIFKSSFFLQDSSYDNFIKKLKEYNIDFDIYENTVIKFTVNSFNWEIRKGSCETNFIYNELFVYLNIASEFLGNNDFSEENVNKKIPFDTLKNAFFLGSFLSSFISEIQNRINNSLVLSKFDKKILKEINSVDFKSKSSEELGVFFAEIADEVMKELTPVFPLYIPAERMLLSMVGESIFGLTSNDVNLPKFFTEFGNYFEKARNEVQQFYIPFLNVEYSYRNKSNLLQHIDGSQVKLENASSGLQSILPLLLVLYRYTTNRSKQPFPNLFVVEEPELNLFPVTQIDLMFDIINMVNYSSNKLIITTHSPYVISTLDNMIQAKNIVNDYPKKAKSVNRIIDSSQWVDFDRVNCYYLNNGKSKNLMDKKLKSIKGNQIDSASEIIDGHLNSLLSLLN